jgi:hypothetical protein
MLECLGGIEDSLVSLPAAMDSWLLIGLEGDTEGSLPYLLLVKSLFRYGESSSAFSLISSM